jgi:tetratricopeptide (TPR) repeat protein
MPFDEFFAEQLELVKDFLVTPDTAVNIIEVDGEMQGILIRMLAGLDNDPGFPHALIGYYEAFTDPSIWFAGMKDALDTQLAAHAEALAAIGVHGADPNQGKVLTSPWRFLGHAQHLAGSLPDNAGAIVFLIDPERVEDGASFSRSIDFLASETRERWLKFIVLDNRSSPRLSALAAEHPRIDLQIFWLPPEEISWRLNAAAMQADDGGDGDGLALAGSFATSNKDFERAETLLRRQLARAEQQGVPADVALSRYTLGNALLAAGQIEPAAEAFQQTCETCSTHTLHELSPMAYTNLGIALHRLRQFDQAFDALKVANTFFRAQGNRPGEAFTCDNLARIHQERGQHDKAERVWRYALKLYDEISNPALQDVREAGRNDILDKLERLAGEHHGDQH